MMTAPEVRDKRLFKTWLIRDIFYETVTAWQTEAKEKNEDRINYRNHRPRRFFFS